MTSQHELHDLQAVLFLARGEASGELARVLWPALFEVERFYGRGRVILVPTLMTPGPIPLRLQPTPAPEQVTRVDPPRSWMDPWESLRVPTKEITRFVRGVLGRDCDAPLVVVTDLALTPPEGWSYVIWDEDTEEGLVVGVPPTDPGYWGAKDEDRLATIKHRVRTAMLSIVGELLGLERCANDRCFLYQDVDASSTLDPMLWLGPEHELAELAGRGFRPDRKQATTVQEVVQLATPETAG